MKDKNLEEFVIAAIAIVVVGVLYLMFILPANQHCRDAGGVPIRTTYGFACADIREIKL